MLTSVRLGLSAGGCHTGIVSFKGLGSHRSVTLVLTRLPGLPCFQALPLSKFVTSSCASTTRETYTYMVWPKDLPGIFKLNNCATLVDSQQLSRHRSPSTPCPRS